MMRAEVPSNRGLRFQPTLGASRRRRLAHARFASRLVVVSLTHELIRALEAQRLARAGARRVEFLDGEINLDRIAASREHIGEAHHVPGSPSGALWCLA